MCEQCDQVNQQIISLATAFFATARDAQVDQRVLVEALLQAARAVATTNPLLTPGAAAGAFQLFLHLKHAAANPPPSSVH